MKIGVFDSGVGGLSVANAIQAALPKHQVVLREDKVHVPYGSRKPEEILAFILPIFDELISEGCQVIVVACNTVTTTLIDQLRQLYSLPLVGIEPMIKLAAELTKSRVIAVCATPTTLSSERYSWLKSTYAKGITVLEPDCSDWSTMIERHEVNQDKIDITIKQVLKANADVIVLGCTHYHWIEAEINKLASLKARVLQPEADTILRLKEVLKQLS